MLLACALIVLAIPIAPASAKHPKRGLALLGVSKSQSTLSPPTSLTGTINVRNPGRRKARAQQVHLEFARIPDLSIATPVLRPRSAATVPFTIEIPVTTAVGSYELSACLEGRVWRGTKPCKDAQGKVAVTAPRARFSISPTSHDFGSVPVDTDSAPQGFTITNTSLIQSPAPQVSTNPGFQVGSNGCNAPLPPGSACAVSVLFHPAFTGYRTGPLRVSATGAGSASATLSGTGV